MRVVATAGHVDHGKSTLVRALTGMEPDRLEEERRRGLTIELGYAWTTLPSGERLAFVDVPGHERFLATMLAGAGPAPAVMFVVAADEGWMPQSEEHLAALDVLGVRHGVLAVTRADLADPAPATEQALARIAESTLGRVEALAVSGRTGAGLDSLREALDRLVARLPAPDPAAPVRLWIDRVFTVRGSGTVVTGTLREGTVAVGDELLLDGEPMLVRALESLKEPVPRASAVARVAVNLRGRAVPERGRALVTRGRWTLTDLADVRLAGGPVIEAAALPPRLIVHIGSAAVACAARPFNGATARLRLDHPLPLHVGDVLLLRDPGRARGEVRVLAGAVVLDVRPPRLARRGAARARGAELAAVKRTPDAAFALRSRGLVRGGELLEMGIEPPGEPVCDDWYAGADHWAALRQRLAEAVRRHAADDPLEPGLPVDAARNTLGLPDRRLVLALVRPPLAAHEGRIMAGRPAGLPARVAEAVGRLRADLSQAPFHAPEAGRLAELGLGPREVAAAVRAGALLRVAEGVVLLPGADESAARALAALPQPFTVSQARQALGTTRRVAVPLLEHLDRRGLTERLDEVRRRVPRDSG